MSEVYVNDSERRSFLDVPTDIVPVNGTMDVKVFKAGALVSTLSTVTYENGRYSVVIPFSLVQEDSELEVRWTFDYVENSIAQTFHDSTYVSVVTPYLPIREIALMLEDEDDFSEDDIRELERATRHVINAFTGQNFGHSTQTLAVRGNGKSSLELPARCIRLNSVNGVDGSDQFYQVRGEGWYLGGPVVGTPPLRADFDGWHEHSSSYPPQTIWDSGPVISSPYQGAEISFIKNATYYLDGEWGWKRVPRKVQEAARLLINDYASGDTVYRDRYLTSMTAADWRIQFHSGAFRQTGNVRADQLLNDFVLQRGWFVF